jgi:aconitate hydratase
MLAANQRAASHVAATIRRLLATAAPKIGDTKVQMSLLEPGKYINYQRIEDNLAIVRKRYVPGRNFPRHGHQR